MAAMSPPLATRAFAAFSITEFNTASTNLEKIHYNVDISNNTELTMQLYSLQTSLRSLWLSRQDPKTEIHKITKISINPSLMNVCLSSLDASICLSSICLSPLYASTLREVVRPVFPPSLEKHWHPRSKAHLEPKEWQFKKIYLQWPFRKEKINQHHLGQTFWGATMLALLGCEFSLCSKHKISHAAKHKNQTWRGGWGPMTDCDRVDWPMKSRTCSKDGMRSYSK